MTDVNPILTEIHRATELIRRRHVRASRRIRISQNLFDHLVAEQEERDRAYPPPPAAVREPNAHQYSLFATPLIVDDNLTGNEWKVDWNEWS